MWVVKLEQIADGARVTERLVVELEAPDRLETLDDFGLTLEDGKTILAAVQQAVVAAQVDTDSEARRACSTCGRRQRIKDYRARTIDTVFGRSKVRSARLECPDCRTISAFPSGRSTPQYRTLRALLAAQLPYRAASDLLERLLPADAGAGITAIRKQVFAAAAALEEATPEPACGAEDMVLGLDTGHIRCSDRRIARHLQVLVGHVEHGDVRRPFACIQDASGPATIRRHLHSLGYHEETRLTAFTDGAEGLHSLPRKAVGKPVIPTLDWFHISMRLQHLAQTARGFQTETYNDDRFKAKVERETERLRWRLWHGRPRGVRKAITRLKDSFGRFRYRTEFERRQHLNKGPRKYWPHLADLDRHIRNSQSMLVNYGRRHRAGQRVSTALVESAVNSIVNQRMNKRRQMRWSAAGADSLLRVRTALMNDELPLHSRCGVSSVAPPATPALALVA